jgi:hypothetical protein
MPDVNVGVTWVKQQTLFYCGPAVLEMVLTTLGTKRPIAPPTWQDQIWADVKANTGATRPIGAPSTPTAPPFPTQKCEPCGKQWKCWATTPGVLEYLANKYQPAGQFAITMHETEKSATASLLDAVDANLPAVALVHGWQHWLVVEGYRHGEANSTALGQRALNGVFIRDSKDTQSAVHYITWSSWKSLYLKFVPCGDYEGAFVVLGGTRRPIQTPPPPSMPTNVRILDDAAPSPLRVRTLKRLITSADALESARRAAVELRGSSRLQAGLDGANAEWATLVQRLDDFDSYYYIVALTAGGRETARVIVDAQDGLYSEVTAIEVQGRHLPPYVPMTETLSRLAGLGESLTPQFPFQVRAGSIGSHPVAVWKPCSQSSSPFMPFYQYSIGDTFVYYRFDGERFDELTEGPA